MFSPTVTGPTWGWSPRHWQHQPRVDMYRAGDAFHIIAEVPGLTEEDIELYIDDGSLTLVGHYPDTSAIGQPIAAERPQGRFSRHIPLPRDVHTERASAKLDRGLLTINLPTAKATSVGRRIELDADE